MRLDCCLVLPSPPPFFSERSDSAFSQSVDDLVSLSGGLDITCLEQQVSLEINETTPGSLSLGARKLIGRNALRSSVFLLCTAFVDEEAYIASIDSGDLSHIELRQLTQIQARQEYSKRMNDLILAANLGQPGSLELRVLLYRHGDRWIDARDRMFGNSAIRDAVFTAEHHGWPPVATVPLRHASQWLQRQSGFINGFSNSKVSRALNSLTYVLNDRELDPAIQMMWTMIGLEALFTAKEDRDKVSRQILRNSSRLLGDLSPCMNRGIFAEMYEVRNQLMHGSMDFAASQVIGDARTEVGNFDNAIGNAGNLGLAVLLSSIQELILRDWNDIRM